MFSRVRSAQRCFLGALLTGMALAAHAQTAADTARLAAASGYLETGGIKIGMPLKDLAPATRALNPLMKLTNTEKVTVWPMDPANTTTTAPPDSPVSVQRLTLQTIQGRTPTTNESLVVSLALYPSMPVVLTINRVIQYPDGTGPNFNQILDAIIAKFGPATETQIMSDSAALRMRMLRWFFDKNGKLLPPGPPHAISQCSGDMANCPDRSLISLNISASGPDIVKSMQFDMSNGALTVSARDATDAYMDSVADKRTQQQNDDSKKRPPPKL